MKSSTYECLKKIGYPTNVLVLDFESKFSTKKEDALGFEYQSTIEYITDPRWEFLGCGFQWLLCDDTKDGAFVDGPDLGKFFKRVQEANGGDDLPDVTVVAKNCKFDIALLQLKFGTMPKFTIDIDDLLRFYDSRMSHKLKDVAKHFNLKPKGDTKQFANLSFDEIKANQEMYDNLVTYTMTDIEDEVDLLEIVLPMVDFTADEAALARHTLELFVYPRFKVDFSRAAHVRMGMEHQLAKVARDYDPKMLGSGIKMMREYCRILTGCETAWPIDKDQCVPLKEGKPTKNLKPLTGEGLIPALAKDDDGCKWLLAHPDPEVRALTEARIAIKSWPTHIGKIKGIVNQARCNPDDMLRVPIHYYGAHTGRWTGGEGINMLNMGSGGRGRPQHPLIAKTRGILVAPDDHMLCIVDSAQIEARMLAWLAGQNDLLKQFANDADPYSDLATDIFQRDVWKWSDDDSVERGMFPETSDEQFKELKREVKLFRGFGKDAILGCGYGMGAWTFYQRCLQNPTLRPLFDSGEYTFEFINKIIRTYRKKYRRITMFWKRVESAWRAATRHPGQTIIVNIPNSPSCLRFYNQGGTTFIVLPSGRRLRYRNAAVGKKGNLKYRHNGHLWGGTITENIDQAASRDLLATWILMAEHDTDYEFEVVLHTYDEIASVVPKSEADAHCERLHEIMCYCPEWATGMPLGAEGGVSGRYRK